MTRSRAIDVLFEFDAPQTFQDLSALLPSLAPGEHDVWFDQIHPQHSKPSADLAREAIDVVRKLQEKEQQLKDIQLKSKLKKWSGDKENQRPRSGGYGNRHLKLRERKTDTSFKDMQATSKPLQVQIKDKKEAVALDQRRKPLVDAHNRLNSSKTKKTLLNGEKKKMKDWQDLLKRRNKKYKATHTYEPPQHSVREVKQGEEDVLCLVGGGAGASKSRDCGLEAATSGEKPLGDGWNDTFFD